MECPYGGEPHPSEMHVRCPWAASGSGIPISVSKKICVQCQAAGPVEARDPEAHRVIRRVTIAGLRSRFTSGGHSDLFPMANPVAPDELMRRLGGRVPRETLRADFRRAMTAWLGYTTDPLFRSEMEVRAELQAIAAEHGFQTDYEELEYLDPETARDLWASRGGCKGCGDRASATTMIP